jgi:hypothetical protein
MFSILRPPSKAVKNLQHVAFNFFQDLFMKSSKFGNSLSEILVANLFLCVGGDEEQRILWFGYDEASLRPKCSSFVT